MSEQPLHILTKMGVLSSFSISQKITEHQITEMLKTAESKTQNEDEVMELVKTKIMKEIMDASQDGTLPGIILESERAVLPVQFLDSLNRMVFILAQKLKSKKIDKMSLCYFINFLVGSLGLQEEDFEEFHRRMRDARGDDDDDDPRVK